MERVARGRENRMVKYLWMVAAIALAPAAHAHGDMMHGAKKPAAPTSTEEFPFGRAGSAGKVSRTVKIDMSDAMRYTPARIKVREGETVKFLIRNSGKVMHEMVIGTMKELKAHAEMMRKFPGMEHDEPYMAHVAPGKTGTLVWQFTRAGEFYFGCLVPGHFESGMIGRITVGP